MEKIKNIALIGILVAGIVVGLLINKSAPTQKLVLDDQIIDLLKEKVDTLGSRSGPDIYSPYISVNGVETWSESKGFNNASTTVCSFKSPAATSTLAYASITINTSTTTALFIDMARSTVNYATTTQIGNSYRLTAGAKVTLVASTTPSEPAGTTVFPPSNYFNIKYAETGNNADTSASVRNLLVGFCKAEFKTTSK